MASIANDSSIDVSVITDPNDIPKAFEVTFACFGVQVPDAILNALHPQWETPEGRDRAIKREVQRFQKSTSTDKHGNRNTIYLKATTATGTDSEKIVGYAIWAQLSTVPGYGEPPITDFSQAMNLEDRYPDDVDEQKYVHTMLDNLNRQRNELCVQQASASPPAILVLDLCVVHPDFQRRGIASKLVQWGLDEARRRGGMVACMEASTMGRMAYVKLGFVQHGPEIEYGVDGAKFAKNGMPSNIFMKTSLEN